MPWTEAELDVYLARELAPDSAPRAVGSDPELEERIAASLRAGLRRLNQVPAVDAFWAGTNSVPTLFKLNSYARLVLAAHPNDTEMRWAVIALGLALVRLPFWE